MDHFIDRMIGPATTVDRLHAELLPSPLLSSVIDGCAEKGLDVTAGGAHYNLSGIQAIQAGERGGLPRRREEVRLRGREPQGEDLLAGLKANFEGAEACASGSSTRSPNTATTSNGSTPSRRNGWTISPGR